MTTKHQRYYRTNRSQRIAAAILWTQRNRHRQSLNQALRRIRQAQVEKAGRIAALEEELNG